MQEANVPVPLFRPDGSVPRSSGPVGRLRRLLNGIARKHTDDGRIKVEKRAGMVPLSRTVAQVESGGAGSTTGIPGTTLMGTLGDELVQIGNSVGHVYAPSGPRYEKFSGVVMTETAQRHVVRASTQTISIMDAARVGTVACHVWSEGGQCYVEFTDITTDTPVRTPVSVAASGGRIKVVADGTRFWVFFDNATTNVTAVAFGTDGASQGSATATTIPSSTTPWDIQAMPGTGTGAVIAHNASIGVDYLRLAFVTFPGTITVTGPVFDNRAPATYGVQFLLNDFDPTHLYIATTVQFVYAPPVDPVRQIGVYVFKLNLNGTHVSTYIIDATMTRTQVKTIANLTGFVDSVLGCFVSWTTQSASGGLAGRAMNNTVTTKRVDPEPSASVLFGVKRSVSLAGRAFKLGTRYVIPCYYASVSQESSLTGGVVTAEAAIIPVAQSTYFLVDILTQDIVGELEMGTASFDWPFIGWDASQSFGSYFCMLPSPFTDADGIVHWTVGYAADLQTVQVADAILGPTTLRSVPEVGILDIRLGGRGIPIEFDDDLLLPGPQGVSFTRDRFIATGIELGAETPAVNGVFNGAGVMVTGESHRYAVVYSVLDAAGNRTRSVASVATAPTIIAPGQNAFSLQIPTLRMTSHATVLIEIYRDAWTGSSSIAQLRKITVDAPTTGDPRVPLYNDPTVDTITFVDTVSNSACIVGAPIYTDNGTLDYFPCPPHSTGCVLGDRVFVGGYDNRVYYSFSKVPGQSLAFNLDEFFITLPTNQRVTAIVPLDNRLFIFCESRIFYVDGGEFLSADGTSGSNPTPIELKFKNGCTGRAEAITQGIVYHSSAGGMWLLTRGLENVYVGSPVEDDMDGATVLDIAVDEDQRIGVLTGSKLIVYDQVSRVWSTWALPVPGVALTTWQGKFTWADDQGTQRTYQQTDGVWSDNGAVIQTRIDIADIATADVFGFQVIWEIGALGEWKGAHTFNVDCTYDSSDTVDETFSETFTAALVPFRFDTGTPVKTECSAIGLSIYDTFPGNVPSQGFTLEALDLYVGVERGKKYNERRIAPAG